MRRLVVTGVAAVAVLLLAARAQAATGVWLQAQATLDGQAADPSTSDLAAIRSELASAGFPDTIPFWQSSFGSGGVDYPYQMVGTNPAKSAQTTVVPTLIIPIDLTFHDVRDDARAVLSGSSVANAVAVSPLFDAAEFAATGDVAQYGDALQRAEFASVLASPQYHVILGTPSIAPTAHIDVPATKGYVEDPTGDGISRGWVTDGKWWGAVRQNLIDGYGVTPNELVIMLTRDTVVGRAIGFHGARVNGDHIQTFVWSSWLTRGWAVPYGFQPDFAQDLDILGHEVAEWLNDPFVDNRTPAWSFSVPPLLPHGCSDLLEVGDPLELAQFAVALGGTTYHLQDEAFLSWFARESPSIGYLGRYSFTGTFSTYSSPC